MTDDNENPPDQDPRPLLVEIDGVRYPTRLTPYERRLFTQECIERHQDERRPPTTLVHGVGLAIRRR
jgi:hypothetical protein